MEPTFPPMDSFGGFYLILIGLVIIIAVYGFITTCMYIGASLDYASGIPPLLIIGIAVVIVYNVFESRICQISER